MFSVGSIGAIGRGVSRRRLWTPLDLGDALVLWLDAADASTITLNGSNVSQWSDKSLYGHHYTQGTEANQPLYLPTGLNGRPALENVSDDFLTLGSSILGRNVGALTCAIAGSYPAEEVFPAAGYDFLITTSTGTIRFLLAPNTGGGATPNRYSVGSRRLDSDTYTAVSSSTDSLASRGNVWIRIGQRAYSDGVANHWTNGTQDMTNAVVGTQGAGNTSDTSSASSRIFQGAGGTPNGTKISQVVVTHSTMANNDRQKLEGFLADRTNSQINLLANHPYKSALPTA